MVKEAVILAAGKGSRLGNKTKFMPKGFIEFDKIPIIERSIRFLLERGIEKIIIGTGHCHEYYDDLAKKIPEIETRFNTRYAQCGSMGTLEACDPYVSGNILLLESDLLYDPKGLDLLLKNPQTDLILASGKTNSGDEVYLEVDKEHNIRKISKNANDLSDIFAELVGITKLSRKTLSLMCAFAASQRDKIPAMEYETALYSIREQARIKVLKEENLIWCEIDDESHLIRAANLIYPKLKKC